MVESTRVVDGKTVIIPDEERRALTFHLENLFRYRFIDGGGSAEVVERGNYVPKVNDLAFSTPQGSWWVSRVDPTTYVADLKLRNDMQPAGVDLTKDQYLSTGSGYASESWRLYLNTLNLPYSAVIDAGFRTYAPTAKWMRIFEGTDTSNPAAIISMVIDQSGVTPDQADLIPLIVTGTYEMDINGVEVPVNNVAIKAPVRFSLSKALQNGAPVTAVFYNDEGVVLKVAHMLVHNTNSVVPVDVAIKRIRGIELVSPWLSSAEPKVLKVPLNVTVSTVGMVANVVYVDGTKKQLPVGGDNSTNQFKLLGISYWSPNVAGSNQRVSLQYIPSPNESYVYPDGATANNAILEEYTLVAEPVRDTYNLKLYVFPTYVSGTTGYRLEGWMYDMTRSIGRRVPSSALKIVEGTASFNGLDYSSVQHMRLSVDMNALDPSYGTYKHVQNVQIALERDGVQAGTNFRVKQSGNQMYWYGQEIAAEVWANTSNPVYSYIRVSSGFTDKTSWLEALFYRLDPLFDRATEQRAPAPTHFVITTATRELVVPIDNWSQAQFMVNDLNNGATLYIKWIRREGDRELQLGVSGLPLKRI